MDDDVIDFSDSEFERMCLEEDFNDAVEARGKYGIPLERACPWMVLILKEWNEPGKFPLDKAVPDIVQEVRTWAKKRSFHEDDEVHFEVKFVGALVNPAQNTEFIKVSDPTSGISTIAIKCSGFGDSQECTTIADMLEVIGSILSEPENEYIVQLREKLSPSAPPTPKGFLQ